MKKNKQISLYTARGAIIAALYVVLTMLAAAMQLSSGVIQLRISEALCVLPIFLPEAVPGLFVGCLISNLLSYTVSSTMLAGGVIWDIIFGSIATLIGAIGARMLRHLPKKLIWLSTVPTILSNMIIVPLVLLYALKLEGGFLFFAITVGIGEIICAGVGGTALFYILDKHKSQWLKRLY